MRSSVPPRSPRRPTRATPALGFTSWRFAGRHRLRRRRRDADRVRRTSPARPSSSRRSSRSTTFPWDPRHRPAATFNALTPRARCRPGAHRSVTPSDESCRAPGPRARRVEKRRATADRVKLVSIARRRAVGSRDQAQRLLDAAVGAKMSRSRSFAHRRAARLCGPPVRTLPRSSNHHPLQALPRVHVHRRREPRDHGRADGSSRSRRCCRPERAEGRRRARRFVNGQACTRAEYADGSTRRRHRRARLCAATSSSPSTWTRGCFPRARKEPHLLRRGSGCSACRSPDVEKEGSRRRIVDAAALVDGPQPVARAFGWHHSRRAANDQSAATAPTASGGWDGFRVVRHGRATRRVLLRAGLLRRLRLAVADRQRRRRRRLRLRLAS